jgi:hypothetical protein
VKSSRRHILDRWHRMANRTRGKERVLVITTFVHS